VTYLAEHWPTLAALPFALAVICATWYGGRLLKALWRFIHA